MQGLAGLRWVNHSPDRRRCPSTLACWCSMQSSLPICRRPPACQSPSMSARPKVRSLSAARWLRIRLRFILRGRMFQWWRVWKWWRMRRRLRQIRQIHWTNDREDWAEIDGPHVSACCCPKRCADRREPQRICLTSFIPRRASKPGGHARQSARATGSTSSRRQSCPACAAFASRKTTNKHKPRHHSFPASDSKCLFPNPKHRRSTACQVRPQRHFTIA